MIFFLPFAFINISVGLRKIHRSGRIELEILTSQILKLSDENFSLSING